VAEASDTLFADTLTQLASTEISLNSLTPELEDSKNKLEKNNSSKTREQLYREIFGIPPPKPPRQIDASLTVNEKVDGRIEVVFNDDRTDFSIPAAPVISMITEMISTELLDLVKSKINSSGRLTKRQLDEMRLETTFESQDYLVHIEIPPDLLSKQVHDLSGYREDPYITENLKPNAVSAYLNAFVNEKIKYFQSVSDDTSNTYYKISKKLNNEVRQPVIANIDAAVNIKGVVLEGGSTYNEMYDNPIQKNDIRLVYDLPKKYLRFTAGDVTYKTTGYLSYVPIGGIGLTKDYSLQPHNNSYPVSDREFFLSEQSEVDIWVNELLVQSLLLEPGTHDIRGFPFASGSNNVRIEIKDFSGRIETLEFSFVHEPILLAKGKSQYTCNAGLPYSIDGNEYIYDKKDPYLLATYKRGLTNKFTFEVYGQSFLDRALAGANGIYALSSGNLHLDLAGSYGKKVGPDFGAKIGFIYRSKVSYLTKKNSSTVSLQRVNPITWNSRLEYLGSGFPESLQDSIDSYEKCIRLSSDLSIPMPGQFNVDLKSSYSILPDSNNIFEISVGFQKTLFRSLRAGANLSYSSDIRTNRANPYVSIQAQWTFISGPNSFAVNETVTRQPPPAKDTLVKSGSKNHEWDFSTDVKWDYLETYQRPQKINAGITAHVGEMYSEYNGRIGYTGNAGSIEFNQNLGTPGYFQEQFIQHLSDLRLKTSVVFADGRIALSRPVYNGFLIAKGVKNLKSSTIRINPHDDDYEATSVWFGPAVLPIHSPYHLQKIKISPLNSSVSSVNDKFDFSLYPQYKSGFLINVGTDITVLVIGILLDKSGNPLGYQSINIVSKDDKNFESINTFTNQAGKFQFMGTAGQTYEMRLESSSTNQPILITIPKDKNDFYRVGEINTDGISNQQLPDRYESTESPVNSTEENTAREPGTLNSDTGEINTDGTSSQPLPEKHESIDSSVNLTEKTNVKEPDTLNRDSKQVVDSSKQIILKRAAETEFKIDSVITEEILPADTNLDKAARNSFIIDPDNVIDKKSAEKLVDPRARKTFIYGTLRDPGGVPMPLTSFEIIPLDDTLSKPFRSFTNKNGRFQIVGSKPGKYRISTTKPLDNGATVGIDTFVVTAAGMGTYQQTGKINLNKSQDTPRSEVLNDSAIKVTGTIEDTNGEMLKFTPVSIISIDTTINTFTDNNGSFQVICRKPGIYMIYRTGSNTNTGAFITIKSGTKGIVDVGRQRIVNMENK
jgi:outer membrane usher protein